MENTRQYYNSVGAGPARYIRGRKILQESGILLARLGSKGILAGGKKALEAAASPLIDSMRKAGITLPEPVWYGGECYEASIEKLADEAVRCQASFLVGIGGGKALDTAKAAAFRAGIPVVTVPTIAATCAATTGISILYNEKGEYVGISYDSQTPVYVFCDLDIVGKAPECYLRAGIGDTAAKWYEFDAACRKFEKSDMDIGLTLSTTREIARLCYGVLKKHGQAARSAVLRGDITFSLAEVVDAIVFFAGMVSETAGDRVRSTAAHAIYGGLTLLEETHRYLHGEIVAFGVFVQLLMEEKPEDVINSYLDFCHSVGLPTAFRDIGLPEIRDDQILRVARHAASLDGMEHMPFPVTWNLVADALRKAAQR